MLGKFTVVAANLLIFYYVRVQANPVIAVLDSRQAYTSGSSFASGKDINPSGEKPRITFRPDGTFKLTIFSDLHFGENPWEDWGPEQDRKSLVLMRKVLKEEGMDYVVLNGDLITGENTFAENSTKLIDEIMGPLNEAKVPFSSTYGNHDNQVNITHLNELERELSAAPLSYTRRGPSNVGGESGEATYWVPVYRNKKDHAPVLILWFFDSRGGISASNQNLPDYVDSSVAGWIKKETELMNTAWGPGRERSALAFVHIPPHAIQAVQADIDGWTNPGLNEDDLGDGSVQDSSDTAKDVPFWDALNAHVKNLRAVVSGHDHGNEWCAREPEKDVIFCFDKHSGYGGYSHWSWGHGVRNFVFKSTNPKEGVESWIRLEDGEKRAEVILDDKYGRKQPWWCFGRLFGTTLPFGR